MSTENKTNTKHNNYQYNQNNDQSKQQTNKTLHIKSNPIIQSIQKQKESSKQ